MFNVPIVWHAASRSQPRFAVWVSSGLFGALPERRNQTVMDGFGTITAQMRLPCLPREADER